MCCLVSIAVQVLTRGILRVSGRRRVDLTIRLAADRTADRELLLYHTLLADIKQFLSERYVNHSKESGLHNTDF